MFSDDFQFTSYNEAIHTIAIKIIDEAEEEDLDISQHASWFVQEFVQERLLEDVIDTIRSLGRDA